MHNPVQVRPVAIPILGKGKALLNAVPGYCSDLSSDDDSEKRTMHPIHSSSTASWEVSLSG